MSQSVNLMNLLELDQCHAIANHLPRLARVSIEEERVGFAAMPCLVHGSLDYLVPQNLPWCRGDHFVDEVDGALFVLRLANKHSAG